MIRLERATGSLGLDIARGGISRLRQEGCLKARFPRHSDGIEAVLINTAGGIAGGDVLATALDLAAGASAVATSQAAERVYRARVEDVPATWSTTLTVGEDAVLDWLPQELILFDGAALRRRLDIRLTRGARFTGAEMVVLGRAASGERITRLDFHDLLRIERDGTLLLHDATRLTDGAFRARASLATFAGWATIVHVAQDAERALEALRASFASGEAGASVPAPGLLLARFLAPDGAMLRRAVLRALDILRGGRPPPRVWQC